MNSGRPDPDQLLARLQESEERERRAKLKIFFGASAGVGKTYAMLVEAHERRRAGTDVVIGVVETHGRSETQALLSDLEVVPRRRLEYRGTTLEEFDLDATLARRPGLVLLDELAHTNAPGSRHAKRWLDVEELLDAGIDVYTTLNVQHVESLYDVVEQITGVAVREIVPDAILERAHEVELVDLPPDDLLQRLREGKVYVPAEAQRAVDHFFRKGNLIALRELALRHTAERVEAQMDAYRRAHAIPHTWPVGGRILVCLGEPESGLRLVRVARRMALRLGAEWLVVHVERPGVPVTPAQRDHVVDVLGYAEELGAETAVLSGMRVADQLLAYARERNVSRIVVGKPSRPRWLEAFAGSLVNTLVRDSGDIDVFVMRGDSEGTPSPPAPAPAAPTRWRDHLGAVGIVALSTVLAKLMSGTFERSNLVMVYLLGVMAVAVRSGRGPAIVASILSVASFDFFFVPPHFTFAVSDTQYLITFVVMLVAALVISTLASRLRDQTDAARHRERRTAALYALSRELTGTRALPDLLDTAVRRIEDVLDSRAVVLLPDAAGRLAVRAGDAELLGDEEHDRGVAQWAFDHEQAAGRGTATLPAARALYLPLRGTRAPVGMLGVMPPPGRRETPPDQVRLLETFANQMALAIERAQLAEQSEATRVQVESERLRNALLSSVSHDLRTPLAVITGAATSLVEPGSLLSESTRRDLLASIAEESQRLNRLVGNLLEMTRLEAGAMEVRRDWHSMEEVVGAAVARLEGALADRRVQLDVPSDLPFAAIDDVLIGQVVYNLLDNAIKYSPAGTPIDVTVRAEGDRIVTEVSDRGPGLPPGEEHLVFDKFFRGRAPGAPAGAGLGLAICRGIVEAHGGGIVGLQRPGGGVTIRFWLPTGGEPPRLVAEDEGFAAEGAR